MRITKSSPAITGAGLNGVTSGSSADRSLGSSTYTTTHTIHYVSFKVQNTNIMYERNKVYMLRPDMQPLTGFIDRPAGFESVDPL